MIPEPTTPKRFTLIADVPPAVDVEPEVTGG
jgi:hypothetical protein